MIASITAAGERAGRTSPHAAGKVRLRLAIYTRLAPVTIPIVYLGRASFSPLANRAKLTRY